MDIIAADHREAIEDFVDEALNSLRGLPGLLDSYRLSKAESEPINAVFRAVHSIKGCAAFLDLNAIRDFSHSLENTLDGVRNGQIVLSEELSREYVSGFDLLDEMLLEAAQGTIRTALGPRQEQLLERVRNLASNASVHKTPEETLYEELLALAECISNGGVRESSEWANRLRDLVPDYSRDDSEQTEQPSDPAVAFTPAELIASRFICGNVDITDQIKVIVEAVLACEEPIHGDRAGAALLGSLQLLAAWATDAKQSRLAESLQAAAGDLQTILNSPIDLDANLLSLIWEQIAPELYTLRVDARTDVINNPQETTVGANERPQPQHGTSQKREGKSRFVRVREERLDEFLEHVSRLFITAELFKDVQSRLADSGQVPTIAEEIRQINVDLNVESRALQRGVMALRRVAVSGLFSKFPSMARTLGTQLGKDITVHTSGEDTEVDKTLAEDLDAPMTHLIRNVVDHGIEIPAERLARGKSKAGNLRLVAQQSKNHVIIIVEDDGGGIDPDRLRANAVKKRVLSQTQAEALSDQEALALIFHPGFSTAEKVSEVSGRGVGMDVVRTTLEKHSGEVTVESQVGVGTTIRLTIPIRQATLVIDGLMVSQSDEQFAVPFENVRELIEVAPDQIYSVHGRQMVKIREQVYSAIHLGDILNLPSGDVVQGPRTPGILVHSKEGALCLLVDSVLGHRQVVVSNLRETLSGTEKMAGVAQLGGGRLALVLNVAEVIKGLL